MDYRYGSHTVFQVEYYSTASKESLQNRSSCSIIMPIVTHLNGWMLLSGSLIRRSGDYDARLFFDLGDGFFENQFFEIHTSGKGVINEVIYLPVEVKHLKFSPMGTAGEFELSALSIGKIGKLEQLWRMMRRVVAMIFLHPVQKRRIIGLNLLRMLVDLQGAYKIAGKLRAHAAAPPYQLWIEKFAVLAGYDRAQINQHISRLASPPCFYLLLVPDSAHSDAVQETLDSLDEQLYRHFTCVMLDTEAADDLNAVNHGSVQAAWLAQLNATLAGKWVMLLRAGDVLEPHALYWLACEALASPGAAVLYADDDVLDENELRCQPRFKPDWSLTHFRATNFIGNAVALRGSEVAGAGGVTLECCRYGSYDLLLRIADVVGDAVAGKMVHVPAVLLHRQQVDEHEAQQWERAALQAHLVRNGIQADVIETLPGCRQVRYRLPMDAPLVSIIVPTRDAPEFIRRCVESLLEKTSYPSFEILVVDNQSADSIALTYLEEIACYKQVRVLRYAQPFNYSAINNFAVQEARGEVVCLLNNDTEVISPDWLEEMVGHLLQPKVGVVGAKLYYPDGRVQHGGDLVGVGGVANHAHAFLGRDDPGYCNRAMVAQELSAVTAACLVTWKAVYMQLGGLDEKHLKVAFNDVDYCLRVREAGYRVVWTPHAELYHYESVSRGKDTSPEKKRRAKREVAYMRKRWKQVMRCDPFYNPNLSYERPDFSLSHAPVVAKPWKA